MDPRRELNPKDKRFVLPQTQKRPPKPRRLRGFLSFEMKDQDRSHLNKSVEMILLGQRS